MSAANESAVFFKNSRGQNLRRWNLDPPEDIRAVLIFLHGLADHIACYEPVAESLKTDHSIHMCGYDQVGHGMSDGARVDISDYQHYVDDLLIFTEIIKTEYPNKPLFVMGYSMGGLVLGHTLLRSPDLCRGAIMYSPAVDASPKNVTPFRVTMAKILGAVFPSLPVGGTSDTALTHNQEELERRKHDQLRYDGGMKARWGSSTLTALTAFLPRQSEIKVPMLIIHGDEDSICSIEGSKTLFENIQSQDKEFKVYKGCYHRVHTETDGNAERFVRDVGAWISMRSNSD